MRWTETIQANAHCSRGFAGRHFLIGCSSIQRNSGKEFRGLTIKRGDMMTAISVFRSAGITFTYRKLFF